MSKLLSLFKKQKLYQPALPFGDGDREAIAQWRKSFIPAPQVNYHTAAQIFQQGFSRGQFSTQSFFDFYQQIMPLQNSVDKIGEKMASFKLVLESESGEFIKKHPFLELLKRPNFEQCQFEFMEALAKDYSIAANAFILVTLSTSNQPLELFILPPQYVTFQTDGRGTIISYEYSFGTFDTFTGVFLDGDIQYLNPDRSQRLLHIKGYNPNAYARRQFGLSKMHGILFELLLYRAGMTHNLSLLNQGARPSMWVKPTNNIRNADALQRFEAEMQNFYSGQSNAGRVLTSNDIESIQQLLINNVDMDYAKLEDAVYKKIFQAYHVPLPIITNEASTFSNYEVAQVALIKDAVIPPFNRISDYLTRHMMPYYPRSADLRLTYFKFSVDALREEAVEEIKTKQPLGIMTDNEMRQEIGLGVIDNDQGDEIWKLSTYVPTYGENSMSLPPVVPPTEPLEDTQNDG